MKMIGLMVSCLLVSLENCVNFGNHSNNVASNEINNNNGQLRVAKVYWNVPTFQCDYHKLNFTGLAEKYNLIQNDNDRFWGGNISILYDPGDFPAILEDNASGKKKFLRNGGVPQNGNLTYHLELFEQFVDKLLPDVNFSGLAIIDFESWRPIFRQNFGSLTPYKELSIDLVKKSHPLWPQFMIEKEAEKRFEFYARQFMEETLIVAKKLRRNATWGYYAYPYCFNMSPNNKKTQCARQVSSENDRLNWLFKITDNLHPSLYLPENRLNAKEKLQMIQGRIAESHRLQKTHESNHVVPYFWYKYQDTGNFVSKEDLFGSFLTLSKSKTDGLIIWGSSNDVNTRNKCLDLFNYVDNVLGPALINVFV